MTDPRAFSLHDVLVHNATRGADDRAMIDGEDELTFAVLLDRVDRLGTGLAALGLERGDRVGIVAHNCLALVELLLACARQALVAVPVNWRWTTGEMERYLSRAGIGALAYDEQGRGDALAAAPGVARRIVLEGPAGSDETAWRDLATTDPAPAPEVTSDSPFCIIATAAVDVIPRGAVLSHGNLIASATQEIATLGIRAGRGNLANLPLFHIAGIGHLLSFLQGGGLNVIQRSFDAAAAVELIDRHSLSYFATFPPILAQVLDAAEAAGTTLPSLRRVSGLEAPETVARLHAATDASFLSGFGQTETSGFVTLQDVRLGPFCAGRPVDLCRLRLVDDLDRPVADGEVGEIAVRGPLVFLGYDGQPEVNELTFRGGWHHTGDLGRIDAEGRLHYVARKPEKELIKPGGENVYPAEVEAVLVEMEGVRRACVFGEPHERWGEGIRAVLETEPGVEPDLEQVRTFVGERIAGFKRPHSLVVVSELPESAPGVIDRAAVRERHGPDPSAD